MTDRGQHTEFPISLLLGFVVVAALPYAVLADSPKRSNEKSLREVREKITEQKQKVERLSKKEGSILKDLDDHSREIHRLGGELERLSRNEREVAVRLEETSAEISKLNVAIGERKKGVSERLRQLYKWGEPQYLHVLLSAGDPIEFRRRGYLVRRWVESDREVLGGYALLIRELQEKQRGLARDRESQRDLLRQRAGRQKELEKNRGEEERLLALVRTERSYYEKSVRDLESSARDLQNLLETLRRKETEGDSRFARLRGKLPPPILGKVERSFGRYTDPYGTRLNHKGIDLRAPEGTPIKAVFQGKVAFSGWFPGYGNILILDHGGGYFTLYAHLQKTLKKMGASVRTGDTIGHVGDTGSLKGAYLYFEVRNRGLSEDPAPWFAAAPERSP